MPQKIIIAVFMIIVISGCATGTRQQDKKVPEDQFLDFETTRQVRPQDRSWGDEDLWTVEKPARVSKPPKSAPSTVLSPKQIQQALKNAGFYQGAIDGKIGPKSKSAIIRFQKANGLKADGVVGSKTSAKLRQHLK